jgi:hypothetical protein
VDVFDTSARILPAMEEGASRRRIMALHPYLTQDEIWWLLKTMVERGLFEVDSCSAHRTTVKGAKFLDPVQQGADAADAKKPNLSASFEAPSDPSVGSHILSCA